MLFVAYPSETAKRKDEVAWIVDRTMRNIANGTQTCIISTYCTVAKNDLSDLLDKHLVAYAEIIHDATTRSHHERTFEINDRSLDIGIFLSELIENAQKAVIPLDIVFHNFSALIHNLGDEDMYRLVTYKASKFDKRTNLILFIYPRSHSERIWEKFKNQAREVIEIEGDKT